MGENDNEQGISRRTAIRGAAATAAAVALGASKANGDDTPSPKCTTNVYTDEAGTVFQILAFWMAVTNPSLPRPLTAGDAVGQAALAKYLCWDPTDKYFQKAYDHVANNQLVYSMIVEEFKNIEQSLNYTPGECPKHLETLAQVAMLTPPVPAVDNAKKVKH
jgi:hypothetical protein